MRWLWLLFVLWCAVAILIPMVHAKPSDGLFATASLLTAVPWMALFTLWYVRKHPDTWIKSLIIADIAKGIVILLMVCLALYILITNVKADGLVWTPLNSQLTVLFLILLLIHKYSSQMDEAEAVLLSIITGAFLIGFVELLLLVVPSTVGRFNDLLLVEHCFMILPFLLVSCRFRPTKYTALFLTLWVALWLIWVFPLNFWNIDLAIRGEAIQWLPYQLSKGLKLLMVPLLFSLSVKR